MHNGVHYADERRFVIAKTFTVSFCGDVVFLPTSSVSAEDLCRYFTTEMANALKSNGADNIKRLHVRVDEG